MALWLYCLTGALAMVGTLIGLLGMVFIITIPLCLMLISMSTLPLFKVLEWHMGWQIKKGNK